MIQCPFKTDCDLLKDRVNRAIAKSNNISENYLVFYNPGTKARKQPYFEFIFNGTGSKIEISKPENKFVNIVGPHYYRRDSVLNNFINILVDEFKNDEKNPINASAGPEAETDSMELGEYLKKITPSYQTSSQ